MPDGGRDDGQQEYFRQEIQRNRKQAEHLGKPRQLHGQHNHHKEGQPPIIYKIDRTMLILIIFKHKKVFLSTLLIYIIIF